MENDLRREALARSALRWCWGFFLLAVLVPLGLHALFERQAGRLDALADHSRPAQATVSAIEQQGSGRYTAYSYVVEGRSYTWNVSWQDAPYAVGESFSIMYLPEDPSLSRPGADPELPRGEAERNRRFARKLLAGVSAFFAVNALLCLLKLRRLRRDGPGGLVVSPEWAGRGMALLILLVLLGTNLDPEVAAVQRRAFGEAPFGAPLLVVVLIAQTILFLPYFWVFPHLMRIVFRATSDRASLSKAGLAGYIMGVHRHHPELRRARAFALGGLAYFVVLCGAWIAYAAHLGI